MGIVEAALKPLGINMHQKVIRCSSCFESKIVTCLSLPGPRPVKSSAFGQMGE